MFVTIFALIATLLAPMNTTAPCIHDDYNDGSQALCYTVNVQTGERVYIDSNDEVVVL